jgi:hypothetical protein
MRPRARCGKPRYSALGDQLLLEFGERGKNAECKAAVGSRRVDLGAGAGQDLQPNAACTQVLDRVDQVAQVAPKPIEFPEHQRVAGLDRLQASGQPGAGVMAPGCKILIDTAGVNASASIASRCGANVWVPSDFETRT